MANMTMDELMGFMEQILKQGTDSMQTYLVLKQLESILAEEQVDSAMQNHVADVRRLQSDFLKDAKNPDWKLTPEVIKDRVEQRRLWELERMRHGRCC